MITVAVGRIHRRVLGGRRSGSLASHQDDLHFSIGELVAETLLEYLNAVNDADHIRAEFSPEGTEFGVGSKGFSDAKDRVNPINLKLPPP